MPFKRIRATFNERFGVEPDVIAIAPGRVNLIGEHTDYNDGFVFPAAIDRGLMLAVSRQEHISELVSVQMGDGQGFDVSTAVPKSSDSWSKYAAGMGWAITKGVGKQLPNLKGVVDSNIPIGSGVSSSAAIELAFGVAWRQLADLELDNRELARLGQICENQFVGVNSGIMDQVASGLGKAGYAMFLDIRSLNIEYVPVPEGLSIVLCDTKKERALTTSAYNERRSQCEEASRVLGVPMLRDANLTMLQSAKGNMSDVVYRRARHVISENQRCIDFKDALIGAKLEDVGNLMRESHESLQHDYEVSCIELDVMAQAAWDAPGCVGARMTGAGFGGACVAMVHSHRVPEFREKVLDTYSQKSKRLGEVLVCQLADGARVIAD